MKNNKKTGIHWILLAAIKMVTKLIMYFYPEVQEHEIEQA